MSRKIKLTLPQHTALQVYAGARPYLFIAPTTSDWLMRKGLVERPSRGAPVLTDKGRQAMTSGYLG